MEGEPVEEGEPQPRTAGSRELIAQVVSEQLAKLERSSGQKHARPGGGGEEG